LLVSSPRVPTPALLPYKLHHAPHTSIQSAHADTPYSKTTLTPLHSPKLHSTKLHSTHYTPSSLSKSSPIHLLCYSGAGRDDGRRNSSDAKGTHVTLCLSFLSLWEVLHPKLQQLVSINQGPSFLQLHTNLFSFLKLSPTLLVPVASYT
jgi:hypothetical protein